MSKILLVEDHFDFPDNLATRVMRVKLSDSKNENLVLSKCTLKRYHDDDICGVHKIVAYEREFLDSNGDIPSGKSVDDLLGYIWAKMWGEMNSVKIRKKLLKEEDTKIKEKEMDGKRRFLIGVEQDEDSEEVENEKEIENDKEIETAGNKEVVSMSNQIPCSIPEVVKDGKWYPVGFPTYVCFVCKFTRINDNFVHLFASDGKGIDASKAMIRKDERKKDAKQKNKDRDQSIKCGEKRGLGDVETAFLNKHSTQRDVENLVYQLEVMGKQMREELKELAEFMYDGDKKLIMESEECWEEILALKKERSEIRLMLNDANKNTRNRWKKSKQHGVITLDDK